MSNYQNPFSALFESTNESKKLLVWNKGRVIPGYDAATWRWDDKGNVMKFSEYGNRNSKHGWEIDHYPLPSALGGSDNISNLRPLHWEANASHGGAFGQLFK